VAKPQLVLGSWLLGFDLRILSPLWRRDAALILEFGKESVVVKG
jgi:hypothetical protein